jgi:hypothetical protein
MHRISDRARSTTTRRLVVVVASGIVVGMAVAAALIAEKAGGTPAAGGAASHASHLAASPSGGTSSAALRSPHPGSTTSTTRGRRPSRHLTSSPATSPPVAALACGGSAFAVANQSWPDCADTGVPAGTSLRSVTSPEPTGKGDSDVTEITTNGAVIDGVNLSGSFDVWADNVTIENSRITTTNWWGINLRQGYTGLRVLHDTIVGVSGQGIDNGGEDYGVSSSGGYVEVGWTDISEVGEGISMDSGYVHDSYIHDLQAFVPQDAPDYEHTDDIISDGGSGLTVEHNTLLNQLPADLGASASVGLYADSGPPSDDVVEDNFVAGGAYAIYPGGPSGTHGIDIEDNVFSTMYWPGGGIYGPVPGSYWDTGGGNVWAGNLFAAGSTAGREVKP